MPQYSRDRQNPLFALGRHHRLISPKTLGAISRSVDWQLFLKWGGVGTGMIGLLLWQWQLMTAIALGVGVMGGIYFADAAPWEQYWEEFHRLWQGESRRLLVSVLGGAITVFVSYGAIALWQSTENHWLVTALLIQGLMIGAILLISLRQMFGQSSQGQQFETALEALSHPSRVKRLYAIRQLRQLLQHKSLTPEQKQTLYTFLRLTWQQETDATLRGALLSILSLYKKQPPRSPQPLQLGHSRPPLQLERRHQAVQERV